MAGQQGEHDHTEDCPEWDAPRGGRHRIVHIGTRRGGERERIAYPDENA